MAESAVLSAIEKLGNLFLEEALLLYGVRDQVKWVETELRRMQCFLKDADAKRGKGDERVTNWVREVIDVSYRAEDVIDTFMLRVERRRSLRGGILRSIKRYALTPAEFIASHKVGMEIKSIRTKIRDIKESRDTYGIANLGETVRDQGEDERLEAFKISPDISSGMDAIVGFDVYGEMVVSQLLDADMKHRCVISIVGMGGLGKTTLAKKVYNSPKICVNFPTRVWVDVSSDFKPQELVKRIARKAMSISRDELEKMEEDEVQKKLYDFLMERRYLIVMDDIWTTDVCRMINAVLPDVTNGSRVLFTTRFVDVSKSAGPNTNSFMLPFLNNDESWELFSKKVFPTTCFPKELEELGQRMAMKCGGLPLALEVLGGILSNKVATPTPIVWMQIEKSMDWGATRDGERCMKILALSYRSLTHHYLKSCFLYIASFPEDSEIYASELIRLWIAEGFIPKKEKEEMEDTARVYLEELVQRSMVQVVSSNYEGVLTCRMHDLLREMGIAEAKQDRFFSIIHGRGSETTSAVNYESSTSFDQNISSPRRLVLHNLTDDVYSRGLPLSHTRSLLLLLHTRLESDYVPRILQGLKLLRVLDMKHTFLQGDKRFLDYLPKVIKFMTRLRYLKISLVTLRLPSSIGKLSNLQTIDLGDCDVFSELPKELGELPNLRHLFLPPTLNVSPPPFTATKKLQTLVSISCDQQWMDANLPRLTGLRRLGIRMLLTVGTEKMLFHSLRELTRLVKLSVTSYDDDVSVDTIITIVSNNDHIHELNLYGKLEIPLPEINRFPQNLTNLKFWKSEMEYDPMPILEKLPNLVVLGLSTRSYNGTKMVCTADGFPRLQELTLGGLFNLENWIVEVGAFPKLKSLFILGCRRLIMLPDGLQHVTSLRELIVNNLPEEFKDRLRKDVGEDWHKIRHVPSITLS